MILINEKLKNETKIFYENKTVYSIHIHKLKEITKDFMMDF